MEKDDFGEIQVTRVRIETAEAGERMGKKQGNYVTLEVPGLRQKNTELQENVARQFTKELLAMANLQDDSSVLVIGLGNWNVTPDALGPRVVRDLLVTRHILALEPETLGEGYRPVRAGPGVLGITGVETSEIIQALIEKVQPDLLIAVDALAARNLARLHNHSNSRQRNYPGLEWGTGAWLFPGNNRYSCNCHRVPTVVMP